MRQTIDDAVSINASQKQKFLPAKRANENTRNNRKYFKFQKIM